MAPLLEVKDLEVAFFTKNGIVHAVNGLSYSLEKGIPWASWVKAVPARASACWY